MGQYTIKSVERRNTKAGALYLNVITTDDEKISLFNEQDVAQNIAAGCVVEMDTQIKGNYLNGKNLRIIQRVAPTFSFAPPMVAQQDDKSAQIKQAQEQRLKEHNEYMQITQLLIQRIEQLCIRLKALEECCEGAKLVGDNNAPA